MIHLVALRCARPGGGTVTTTVAVAAESFKFYSFKGLQRKPGKKLAQARRLGPNPPKEGGGDTVRMPFAHPPDQYAFLDAAAQD
jgi:hypothetical protein